MVLGNQVLGENSMWQVLSSAGNALGCGYLQLWPCMNKQSLAAVFTRFSAAVQMQIVRTHQQCGLGLRSYILNSASLGSRNHVLNDSEEGGSQATWRSPRWQGAGWEEEQWVGRNFDQLFVVLRNLELNFQASFGNENTKEMGFRKTSWRWC